MAAYGYPPAGVADYVRNFLASPAAKSAKAIISDFLNQYGLQDLANWAWGQYLALGGGPDAIQQIQFELPQQKAFQVRFPAYAQLAKQGHAMTPGDMIQLEKSYTAALRGAGLPAGFYDHPDDFAKFILADVSPAEVAQRAQLATSIVLQEDPAVINELRSLGVPASHQVAFILDPTRALPLVQNAVIAAQTGYGQLTAKQALGLASSGVSAEQARAGFTQLAGEKGLFQGTTAEGTNIGVNEQLAAEFTGNSGAQQRIQKRQAERVAAFKGAGGYNPSQQGVSGLGQPA